MSLKPLKPRRSSSAPPHIRAPSAGPQAALELAPPCDQVRSGRRELRDLPSSELCMKAARSWPAKKGRRYAMS